MWIVTGACGFIGSQMVRELNRHHIDDVVIVDPVAPAERPLLLEGTKYTQWLHRDELWAFLEKPENIQKIEWIIHMGANSSTTETNWDHLLEVNTHYTQKIFEWCSRHQKNLIYASSAATYGAGEKGYDDTTDPLELKALNLYGRSKLEFDQWALAQGKSPAHWYGLKFFNVYGPGEMYKGPMSSVVYKSFHQIKKQNFVELFKSYKPDYKDGEQKRDFIYVKEVTGWMWELTQKKPKSQIYNMGTGIARTWVDLARATFSALNLKSDIRFIEMPESLKSQYQYLTEARMQKWSDQSLSSPKWTLEKGISDYVQEHLNKGEV